jgi:Ni/Co efflux regulator RcnB
MMMKKILLCLLVTLCCVSAQAGQDDENQLIQRSAHNNTKTTREEMGIQGGRRFGYTNATLYEKEKNLRGCCGSVRVPTLKYYDLLEKDRDYSKKSTFVFYRDFIEEIANRTLFGIPYWFFGTKVL